MPTTDRPACGPHQAIAVRDDREKFLAEFLDALWDRYRQRVDYVRTYEEVVARAGATFVNDHIAFRTLACQEPHVGIASVSRLFEALGYRAAGCYFFADKFLSAVHFQHPQPAFPKLFISELQTWQLDTGSQEIIFNVARSHKPALSDGLLSALHQLNADQSRWQELLATAVDWICTLPWRLPDKSAVAELNKTTQYGAWVLVHGYNVNHFTSLINSHGVSALDDIEKTIAALKDAGVPMKAEIEGAAGSKLRQTATEAVMIDVDVQEGSESVRMPWSYAYFELAQRGEIADPETGRRARFEGFLGPQATNLFEMTRVK